ncbi:MAG: hypothetical protein EBY53_02140 [Rhodobacteraceae bacterium]|nr:hypothetical protein [Paracoccaceae bacterium]
MNNAPFAQKLSHITEPYRGKNDQMQVIGLCRFSYPALGGFQREHETIEQRKAFLYDEAHLKHRLRLFRAFNLPSILAQTDTDFQYLILVGNDLPVWARDQLNDLTKWADHIKILPYPHFHIARLRRKSFWIIWTPHMRIQFSVVWMMMMRFIAHSLNV